MMPHHRSFAALPSFLALIRGAVGAGPDCYYPNGTLHNGAEPCNTSIPNSACCGVEDVCLSNGYCYQQLGDYSNRIARGTCTDINWKAAECPAYCADVKTGGTVTIGLVQDSPGGQFCCTGGPNNYNLSSGNCTVATRESYRPFELSQGAVIYDRSNGQLLSGALSTATPAPKSDNIAPVAAGIAVPLGVLLLAALAAVAVLWVRLREAQRQIQQGNQKTSANVARPPPGVKPHNYWQRYPQPVYEAPAQPRVELPAPEVAKEAPASP